MNAYGYSKPLPNANPLRSRLPLLYVSSYYRKPTHVQRLPTLAAFLSRRFKLWQKCQFKELLDEGRSIQ